MFYGTRARHVVSQWPRKSTLRRLALASLLLACFGIAEGASAHPRWLDRAQALTRRLQESPDDPSLYLERALVWAELGRAKEGLADVRSALRAGADRAEAALAEGWIRLATGEPRRAELALDRALALAPLDGRDRLRALRLRARARALRGRHREAAVDLERIRHDAPHRSPQLYLDLARQHLLGGNDPAAELTLAEGLAAFPRSAALRRLALETHITPDQTARGRERLDRWMAHDPPPGNRLVQGAAPVPSADVVVPFGSSWRYLDDGSDQGTAWRAPGFDDLGWSEGPAQLGYSVGANPEGDEATVLDFGGDPANKHVTYYFRHSFDLSGTDTLVWGQLQLLRDDGAVAYLNGVEIARSNMPQGPVTYETLAAANAGTTEGQILPLAVDPDLLVDGSNTLAVEVHQHSPASSDVSFDLSLVASDAPVAITRGPYLQLGTPTSVVVRWRSDVATDSRVRWGLEPGGLSGVVDDGTVTTDHQVLLQGLPSDQRLFYSVGTTEAGGDEQILAGADAEHFFVLAPENEDSKRTRIWVLGDSGTGSLGGPAAADARAVRDAYLDFVGEGYTDLWLMLGDNAYPSGTEAEYQAAVFEMYPQLLRTSVLWPAIGNHDGVSSDSVLGIGPYFDLFTLPTAAEAGGVPSGTEAYYSFDHANLHFIVLDSHGSDRSAAGAMMSWLEDDLLAASADWIVALWHHPPYSKGSHDSDNPADSAGRLTDMRENALPLLEAGGVDLVLAGHSHSYERSYLLDGHYGPSSTLSSTMVLDPGDGRPLGDGAYNKPTGGLAPHEGAVYVVAGSAGRSGPGSLNHPAMLVGLSRLGSLVLDVSGLTLQGYFLEADGSVGDTFSLTKGPEPTLFEDDFETGDLSAWTWVVE